MLAKWTDLVLMHYSSQNNIFEKESENLGISNLGERAIESFDGGF